MRAFFAGIITAFFLRLVFLNTDYNAIPAGPITLPLWSLFIILPLGESIGYVIAAKVFSKMPGARQLARFGIVGLMNFSVDAGILTALVVASGVAKGEEVIGFNIVSASIAIINSYFWQRSWTFKEKAPASKKEFSVFVFITIIGIAINTAVVYFTTGVIHPFDGLTPERVVVVAKIIATFVSLIWNFLGYKFFVFR